MKMSQPAKEVVPGIKAKNLDLQDVFLPFFKKTELRYLHAFTELNIIRLLKKSGFEIIKNVSNTRNIITIAKKDGFELEKKNLPKEPMESDLFNKTKFITTFH